MPSWSSLFSSRDSGRNDEFTSLLPSHEDRPESAIPAKEVTRIALRLKHQIEVVVPCELEEDRITAAHSNIITPAVIATAKSAGKLDSPGNPDAASHPDYSACVVYCLLVCKKWFKKQALLELWDADLHDVRAVACEVLAKHIIEEEEDLAYLLRDVLLKRYSIVVDGEETAPANAIERAADLHALRVIGSSGYQKCISYLWRGWLVQDDNNPNRFIDYKNKTSASYWVHLDPDRMRVPMYQNAVQVAFSLIFLALYTGAINTINPTGDLDVIEGLLYLFTLGFACDEIAKFWKVGRAYLGFWNTFNNTLYALLATSFITRMIALAHPLHDEKRNTFNTLSYNFLAFSAPMFWCRLLLYLDSYRFFGAMLVVLKVMMKESLIFFALLFVVCIGFLQAFIGLDQVDESIDSARFICLSMLNAMMGSPEFDGFDNFAPPFGLILYYLFNFIIVIILLNVLIALYNSAYEDITDDAIDEYMALFAQKTIRFVRAPDENVYIAPFNLIEIFCLIIPFEWWMSKSSYEVLNDYVMGLIYSPLLCITAALEVRVALRVQWNRKRGEQDEDTVEEWEQLEGEFDFEGDGWAKKCEETKPNVETDTAVVEIRELRREVEELKALLVAIKEAQS